MSPWLIWMISAGALLALEMFSGSFYLLMIGIGFVFGGLTALGGGGFALQFAIAGIVGMLATFLLWKLRGRRRSRADMLADDGEPSLDIGQALHVDSWRAEGGIYVARASYRGAEWDIELRPGSMPAAGHCVIREIRGNRLIVDRL
jgi:membrane protein implicated in regulation of membrane protease activity